MAATTLFAIQNIKHSKIVCPYLGFKYLVMTVVASQPLGMRPMWEPHHAHTAAQIEQHIHVKHWHRSFRKDSGTAGFKRTTFYRVYPAYLIARASSSPIGKFGEKFTRFLKFANGRPAWVMYAILRKLFPFTRQRPRSIDQAQNNDCPKCALK